MDYNVKHISIEGFDGVGKTTIAKILENKLDYLLVEKPLAELFDFDNKKNINYLNIRDKVNESLNRDFTTWFYCLGSLFMYGNYMNKKIITDRHIGSNYAWSNVEHNHDIFNLIINKIGKPSLTIILYANKETIEYRLKKRSINDKNLDKINFCQTYYERLINFYDKNNFNYILIDTNNMKPDEIVSFIIKEIGNE